MRAQSILATAALLGLTTASPETSTVTLFLFGFDPQPLVASVMGSSGAVTTYSIECKPGTDSSDCGLPPSGMTLAEGPSTVSMEMEYAPGTSGIVQCSLGGTTRADCVETVTGSTSSAVLTSAELTSVFLPVVVTAGNAAAATTPAGTGATPAATTAAATGGSSGSGSASGSASASASASAATASHTNAAAPVMGGSIMGGVVAAAAAAALL